MDKLKMFEKQEKLIRSVEGIGDILVYETKKSRNKLVLNGLERIFEIINALILFKQENPDKFKMFVVSKSLSERGEPYFISELEKYLTGFSTPINQLIRVFDAAIQARNEIITNKISIFLISTLTKFTSSPGNEMFINLILDKLNKILFTAIKENSNSQGKLISWYSQIVFNTFYSDNKFDISYLDIFNTRLFHILKRLIKENHKDGFKTLVISHLVDGIHMLNMGNMVSEYGSFLLKGQGFEKYRLLNQQHFFERKLHELSSLQDKIYSNKLLAEWMDKFNEIKLIVEENINSAFVKDSKKLEIDIYLSIMDNFKSFQLQKVIFCIGGYCLFKKEFSYIKILLECKQPPDSVVTYISNDIVPDTLTNFVSLYFNQCLYSSGYDYWEDHHDWQKYNKEYFILLLARFLQLESAGDKNQRSSGFTLPTLDISTLTDLKYNLNEYFPIVKEIKSKKDLLSIVGFNMEKLDEIFDSKVVLFLKKLQEKIDEQIKWKHINTPISDKKIESFETKMVDSFYKKSIIRNLFSNFIKSPMQKKDKNISDETYFGQSLLEDRAIFFDEWNVSFGDLGSICGAGLAEGEDSMLYEKISTYCKNISTNDLEEELKSIENIDEIFIISTPECLLEEIYKVEKYNSKESFEENFKNINGLYGWLKLLNYSIPIFTLNSHKENSVLILDKKKLGMLVQSYTPLEEKDDYFQKDIFYMKIKDLSKHHDIIDRIIESNPAYLKKYATNDEKKEYLKIRVIIEIFEKFDFEQSTTFQGMKIIFRE